MAEVSASSALPGPPIGPRRTNFEWTLPLPESPFYKEEYVWSSNSQVQSCTLCNEELHRTPIFDSLGNVDPTGESDLDLLAKKYIRYHFTSVRHEDNLKKAMKIATGKSNATSTTKQPNTKTQMPAHHSTGTGHGTTQRRSRSRRKSSSPQRTCVICKASSLHMVGTKADGPFILSAAHLDQLHHKRSITRFQELAEEETRLIEWKKPSTATAIAFAVLEIATVHDLPTDVGRLILKFSGIQEIVPPTTHLTCTTSKSSPRSCQSKDVST